MTTSRAGAAFAVAFIALSSGALRSSAQALPAATAPAPSVGFRMPSIGGSLQYSVSAAESLVFGNNGQSGNGTSAVTSVSGDLAYLSKSSTHPFSAVYSGGYLIGASSQPSYPFQNLALSQVLQTPSWNFVIADSVSYLPQTPTSGLSGIPGVGDLGVNPVQVGDPTGLGILTDYQTRIANTVSGTVSRKLTARISAQGTGNYGVERFTGGSNGIDSNQFSVGGGLTDRIDARSSLSALYNYSHTSFPNTALQFTTQGFNVGYNRQLSRQLGFSVSAGPQRVSSSNSTLSGPSTSVAVNAGLSYAAKVLHYGLSYNRGVTNGSGVTIGTRTDSVSFNVGRQFGRYWSVAGDVGYNHSDSLPSLIVPSFSNNAFVVGGQASRGIGRYLSVFAQYTLQRQSVQGTDLGNNAYSGLYHVLGFGITYSPKPFIEAR